MASSILEYGGPHGRDRMVVGYTFVHVQLPVQSVPITTNIMSSNPAQVRSTRYNIM